MTPPTIAPTGVECEGDLVSCGFAESVVEVAKDRLELSDFKKPEHLKGLTVEKHSLDLIVGPRHCL